MTIPESKDLIRAAGGIVHSDGNIFFTNRYQFEHAASLVCGTATIAQPSMDKELIRRLAEDAQLAACYDEDEGSLHPCWIESIDLTPYLSKFAALVAEECAKEVDKQDYEWSCSACSAAKNSAAAIRTKFAPI